MKWNQAETSKHQLGIFFTHLLCCSAGLVSPYPWPPPTPQWTILWQLVHLKKMPPSHPNNFFFFYYFSFLVQTVPQTHLSSDYIKFCLCSGGVCVQPEIQAGQLCRSIENLSLIYIPNLSSPQHSLSLNRRAAWSLKHTKITFLHGWVISIILWPVYAQF